MKRILTNTRQYSQVMVIIVFLIAGSGSSKFLIAQTLRAGTGMNNITAGVQPEKEAGDPANQARSDKYGPRVHDPLYAKALVIENDSKRVAIVSMDVLGVGRERSGAITEEFLLKLRNKIENKLGINREYILVNASHNHSTRGQIAEDVVERTFLAVEEAVENMEPVTVGSGSGQEDRITMNRRVQLKNGKVWTIRHSIPCPPDKEVAGVGPMDPEIGILKFNRKDGTTKAVVYNFAAHPYTGVPGGGVTAELPGFASEVIENQLGEESMALFLQGACGDITEVLYKDVNRARNCKPFGRMLGLITMKALRKINTEKTDRLSVINETIHLPLRTDIPERLQELNKQEQYLLGSLQGTSLNLKTFMPLYIKYNLFPEYPSYYKYRYLQEKEIGSQVLKSMDRENLSNIKKYYENVVAMEKLARIQENKAKLKFSKEQIDNYADSPLPVEIQGMRIGDFVVVTFPGEVFVEVGLNIKEKSPYENTFMAAYSNGYIHYAPTADAFEEWAYEDMRSILSLEWQNIYEKKILQIIKQL